MPARNRYLFFVLPLLLAVTGFYVISRARRTQSTAKQPDSFIRTRCIDEAGNPMNDADGRLQYRCLDRKALLAQSGDPAAVRELADAVVEFNGTGGAPAVVLDQFEAR